MVRLFSRLLLVQWMWQGQRESCAFSLESGQVACISFIKATASINNPVHAAFQRLLCPLIPWGVMVTAAVAGPTLYLVQTPRPHLHLCKQLPSSKLPTITQLEVLCVFCWDWTDAIGPFFQGPNRSKKQRRSHLLVQELFILPFLWEPPEACPETHTWTKLQNVLHLWVLHQMNRHRQYPKSYTLSESGDYYTKRDRKRKKRYQGL